MIDHGQLSPPTPLASSRTVSRTPSFGDSNRAARSPISAGLKMSTLSTDAPASDTEVSRSRRPSRSGSFGDMLLRPAILSGLTMSTMETDGLQPAESRRPSSSHISRSTPFNGRISAFPAGLAMSSIVDVESAVADSDEEDTEIVKEDEENPISDDYQASQDSSGPSTSPLPSPPILLSPSEISAQLPTSLASLRRSSLIAALNNSTPVSLSKSRSNSISSPQPILVNASCSGYFIEPARDF